MFWYRINEVSEMRNITLQVIVIFLLLNLSWCFADSENWDHFIYGGRDIHSIAQDDSIMWIGTDISLVKLNMNTGKKKIYDKFNGLPKCPVSAIEIDSVGNVWFGTGDFWTYTGGNGLVKFDGENWEIYNQYNSEMNDTKIWDLLFDSSGNLWVVGGGLFGCSVIRFDGTTWTDFNDPVLPDRRAYCIEEDDLGNIWIGTAGGLLKYDGSAFTLYNTQNSPLISVHVHDLIFNDGKLWMGLFGGVVCKEDSIWKHWDFDNSRLLHSVRSLALDSEGNIWAGTYEGLTMFDGTSWQQDTSCPVRSIWRLYFDDNDDYWVGSYVGSYGLSKGLYKKHNNNWTYYKTSTNDLLSDKINCVCAKDNIRWFGTSAGLAKYDGRNWYWYDENNSDLPYSYIQDVEFDNEGNLWVSTVAPYTTNESPYGALVKFDGSTWNQINLNNSGLNTTYIHSISSSSLGMIWLGTDAGAACYNNGTWSTFTTANSEILDNWVYDIYPLESEIWFGSYTGLTKLDGYGWETITSADSILPSTVVLNIEKSGNKLWFETRAGLSTYDGHDWETFTSSNSILPEKYYYSLSVVNDDVWVGTGKGLFRYHDSNWIKYYADNSDILGNIVSDVASDGFNNIWITCPDQGISVFNDSTVISNISDHQNQNIPQDFILHQNFPNPLNPTTTISYELPEAQNITLQIYDITGRLVETLYKGYKEAGHWDLKWNASEQSSGVYIYRLQVGDRCISKKMVVLK
jgi:ligand-binding sensor domain-containing protein